MEGSSTGGDLKDDGLAALNEKPQRALSVLIVPYIRHHTKVLGIDKIRSFPIKHAVSETIFVTNV